MENFKSIKIDNRLNKDEIAEIKELSKDEEKLKALLETNNDFKDFITSEYRWANENYLAKNGKTVKYLQNALGFTGKDIDGSFGKKTFFAVIQFQKENGLVVDGLVGNKTQAALVGKNKFTSFKIKEYFKTKENNNGIGLTYLSEPYEKRGGMTYCSKTARKNLYKLGVSENDVPRGSSAIASMNMYGNNLNYANNFEDLPDGSNVLDLFVDTTSRYEHRAAAYLNNGEWFVLDPYSNIHGNTRSPIPMNNYIATKKLMGIFPHSA